jgi:alpha-galactosidase
MVVQCIVVARCRFVNLDDCWQAAERVNGHVVSHPENFPSGIKALAKYAHDKGLKLGL